MCGDPRIVPGIRETWSGEIREMIIIIFSLFSSSLLQIHITLAVAIVVTPHSTNNRHFTSLLELSIRRYRQCISWHQC